MTFKNNALLLFQSTREVIKAEKICQDEGIAVRVIPVPRSISAECGMALEVDESQLDAAKTVLRKIMINVKTDTGSTQRVNFDLLSTVEYGGCSAKMPPGELSAALEELEQKSDDKNLLVDISLHDDAGVYQLTPDYALIQTTDFFPPICSSAYEFGQIAAANALSDIYAMGGEALTALNIVLFPHNRIPLAVLKEMLSGGLSKVKEAGAVIVGGHTIDDYPPKYGLAVTGWVKPSELATNNQAKAGDLLVLSKPLGNGVIVAGKKLAEVSEEDYQGALDQMKLLNRNGALAMRQFGVKAATDITGFSLLGHSLKMAQASGVNFSIDSKSVPILAGAYRLVDMGCIPGAAFRVLSYVEPATCFAESLDYNLKMLLLDAQTSGGLLICISENKAEDLVNYLKSAGYPASSIIGEVKEKQAGGPALSVS